MKMNNADMPAMPLTGDAYTDINGTANCQGSIQDGMGLTKREHFAGLAMQAMISSKYYGDFNETAHERPEGIAVNALRHADALLTELNKGE
jgi:hypothetical protein